MIVLVNSVSSEISWRKEDDEQEKETRKQKSAIENFKDVFLWWQVN